MTLQEAIAFIIAKRGRFFGARFVKRTDGEPRRMVARTGVHKGTAGGCLPFDADERGLIVVWDVAVRQHRMIPTEGLRALKCGHGWQRVERG